MKRIVTEGITAGALGATAVAAWFLLYDAAQGRPYFTPALLGAVLFHGLRDVSAVSISWPLVLGYSLFHWAAFVLFGIAAAALLAGADRQPTLLFVFVMLVCCFEVFALALVAILAEWLFEALAWWSIVVANGLALAVMLSFLGRRHRRAWQGLHAFGMTPGLLYPRPSMRK
jgi:hypothetical protein